MRDSKTKFVIRKNHYHHFLVGFFVFMGSLMVSGLVASVFAPVSESSAQTITVENAATGYYVSVTSPDTVELEVDATPVGQTVVSSASTINVKTNAPLGYKLYLSTENDELTSTDSTITQTFKPITSTSLTTNTWGFSKTGADNSWLAVPEVTSGNESSGYLLASSTTPNIPDGDNINVYYGINSDTTMPSGTYTTTVTYTAIGDGIPEEHTMQEFTMAECINMPVDKTFYLIDSRNNKIYSIIHAKDGNCWMTQNLSIYNQQISSADSNLPDGTTITLPESTTWNTNDYTNMKIHIADGTGEYADKTGEYYGEVYYDWCASIGETNCGKYNIDNTTINQSICPKGWRLPINGDETVDKSYAKLLNVYGVTTGAELLAQTKLGFDKYYGHWSWNDDSEWGQGVHGVFWSSTANSETATYRLNYHSTSINPQHSGLKGYGFSIRCVQENRALSDVTYMQDVYGQICANTAVGATKTLLDKRGVGNAGGTSGGYGVLKAKDGNCWMTSNLNLYNKALTPNDTDIPSNITLPASTNWNTNDTTNLRIHVATNSGYAGEVYYSWCSAIGKAPCNESADTTINQSICPRGWQLPIYGNASQDKSYMKLMNTYAVTTGAQLLDNSNPAHILGFHSYYGRWAWSVPSEYDQGVATYFRLSSTDSNANTHVFTYNATTINSQTSFVPGGGLSLRCVLK